MRPESRSMKARLCFGYAGSSEQIGATGFENPKHRNEHGGRTLHANRDRHSGGDLTVPQTVSDAVRALVHIGICEAFVFAGDGRSPRRVSGPLLEELMNARSGRVRDRVWFHSTSTWRRSASVAIGNSPTRRSGSVAMASSRVRKMTEHALTALAHEPGTHVHKRTMLSSEPGETIRLSG